MFISGHAQKKMDIINPTTEEFICLVPMTTGEDVVVGVRAVFEWNLEQRPSTRYFAGWADNVLTFTKKKPNGLITPWNYPLMILSWKMTDAITAGNTVVIKSAQLCPLTELNFS